MKYVEKDLFEIWKRMLIGIEVKGTNESAEIVKKGLKMESLIICIGLRGKNTGVCCWEKENCDVIVFVGLSDV